VERFMPKSVSLSLLCSALLAWSVAAGAISYDEARHLLVRTGFEATPAAIARFKPLRYEHAVDRLLKESRTDATTPPPAWVSGPFIATALSAAERQQHAGELKGWWVRELRTTGSPLTERMTLFWHGHFASDLGKVRSPALAYRHNLLLRRHALGDFRTLLRDIAQDPAMLIQLDAGTNRKGQPNLLFARHLLERFTLGPSQFKARDLEDAARAFTGWRVNAETGSAEFNEQLHDGGVKLVLGHKGKLDGAQVIDTLLRDPRTAEHIVDKLWREFVSDTPDRKEVQRLAKDFRKNYRIKPLVRALLLTKTFRSPAQRGRMIKSPIELLVGTVRQFELALDEDRELAHVAGLLGQDLFEARDWSGGADWITGVTLPLRQQALARLLRGVEGDGGIPELASGLRELTAPQLTALLLPVPAVDPVPAGLSNYDLAAHLVRDPAYQLK
jgi:uncharacterized protein (DUF1800 family)